MNYEQAMEYIHAVQWAGHKKLQFVDVAGTIGMGSRAARLASCVQGAG